MAGKEVRAGRAFVEIMLRDHLQAGLNRAAKRLKSFGSIVAGMGAALGGVSAGILAPLAAAVTQFSSTGDAVEKMAARTGLSAEAVSELSHAANLSGTDLGAFENGVKRMQRTVVDAAGGLNTSVDALTDVGLTAQDLDGLMPDDQFALIADRLSGISDPAHRAAAAMEIFGRSGTDLIPMMAGGAAGIEQMRQQARDLGLTISGETAASAARLNDAMGTMWSTIKGLTLNIGAALAPAVTDLVNRITPLVGAVVKFIQNNQRLVTIVAAVGVGLGVAAGVLLAVGTAAGVAGFALSGLATIAGGIFTAMSFLSGAFMSVLLPIGLVVAGVTSAVGAFLYFSGTGGKAIAWLQDRFGRMVDFVKNIAGEITAALAAGDVAGAARMLWDGIKTVFAAGVRELASLWGSVVAAAKPGWDKVRSIATAAWSKIVSIASSAAGRLANVWTIVSTAAASLWQAIVTAASSAMQAMGQLARSGVGVITGIFTGVGDTISSSFSGVAGSIARVITAVPQLFANVVDLIGRAWQALGSILPAPLGAVVTAAGDVLRQVAGLFRGAIGVLSGILSPIASAVGNVLSVAVVMARAAIAPIALVIGGAFRIGVAIATKVASALLRTWSAVVGTIGKVISTLVSVASKTFAGIVRIGSQVASIFAGPFRGLVSTIGSLFASIIELGGSLLSSVIGTVSQIGSTVSQIGSSVLSVLSRPIEALKSAWGTIANTARSAWSGLTAIAGTVASSIGNAFSGIAGMIQSAFGNVWQFLASGAAGVGNFFMGMFSSIGSTLGSLVAGISQTFSAIAASAMETFGAIGQALASGDFGLAAEIAWTSIRLAFATGMAAVTNAWTAFATGLTSIFDGAIVAVRQIWNNISTWIARQIFNIVSVIQKAVAKLAAIDPTGLSDRLSAAIEFDVDGAIKILAEDAERFNTGLDTAKSDRDDTRVDEMRDRIASTEADLAALRERRQKSIDEASSAAEASSGGPSLLDKILGSMKLPELPKMFEAPELTAPPVVTEQMQTVASTGPSLGTFSSAVAGMLGRSGESDAADRTAEASEATATATAAIQKELEDRPVLAFDS